MDIVEEDSYSDSSDSSNENPFPTRHGPFNFLFTGTNHHSLSRRDTENLPPPQRLEDAQDEDRFDTNLPSEHSYLGETERVSGVVLLEPGKKYKLPVLSHHSLVFPGEQFPIIMNSDVFDSAEILNELGDGFMFGLLFLSIPLEKTGNKDVYGVTCQIYERGPLQNGMITVKSKAYQRFVCGCDCDDPPIRQNGTYKFCRILPEIVSPDSLFGLIGMNSLAKFRGNNTETNNRLRRFEAASMSWPSFVYNRYNQTKTIEKIKSYLPPTQIDLIPTEPITLSFWCSRNVLLEQTELNDIFLTNSVTKRMLIVSESLKCAKYFLCKICKSKLALYKSLFAMSKQGIQSKYCNPAGYIHETNTVYSTLANSVYVTGQPSTEFSWFPGYAWQIALCFRCNRHLGWKFTASTTTLVPKWFYGLSGSSVIVKSKQKKKNELNEDDDVFVVPNSNASNRGVDDDDGDDHDDDHNESIADDQEEENANDDSDNDENDDMIPVRQIFRRRRTREAHDNSQSGNNIVLADSDDF